MTDYQEYYPVLQSTNLKKDSYDRQKGVPVRNEKKKSNVNGGIIAVAVVTTLAVVALIVIGVIAIIWALKPKASSSSGSASEAEVAQKQVSVLQVPRFLVRLTATRSEIPR